MILINSDFWTSVGVSESDGNPNGNQYGFYNTIEMSNAVTVKNQYEFFLNSPVNGIYYNNQYEWYRAIGLFHSEPIYDMYSFYNNITIDGVNPVRDQYEFFKSLKDSIDSSFIVASSFLLDGVNESFNIDNVLPSLATSSVGTWAILIKPVDGTPPSGDTMIAFGDTDAHAYLMLYMNPTGTARALTSIGGVLQWDLATTTFIFNDNVWTFVVLVKTATSSTLYIDGVAPAQSFNVSVDKTTWFNDIAGLDNGRIGALNFDNLGDVNNQNGNISQVAFLSTDIDAAQVLDWHNNGSPKNPKSLFGSDCKMFFNPDNSGSTAQFTVTDPVNGITSTSINMEDDSKTTVTPY